MKETIDKEKMLDKNVGKISAMFDSIAPSYDKLNHILSFGVDKSWRRKLLRRVKNAGAHRVLDLACGSGDVSIALNKAGFEVVGADISNGMLDIARQKSAGAIVFVWGDAAHLPFESASFDAVTISFGIRNFDKLDECVREICRVLKPGGSLHVLEFGIPSNRLWRAMYTFYSRHILPTIGRLISGDKGAYTYLPESTFNFPYGDDFINKVISYSQGDNGFQRSDMRRLSGGIAYLYTLYK